MIFSILAEARTRRKVALTAKSKSLFSAVDLDEPGGFLSSPENASRICSFVFHYFHLGVLLLWAASFVCDFLSRAAFPLAKASARYWRDLLKRPIFSLVYDNIYTYIRLN